MSVSKWAYSPEICDGNFCPGECDECPRGKQMAKAYGDDLIAAMDKIWFPEQLSKEKPSREEIETIFYENYKSPVELIYSDVEQKILEEEDKFIMSQIHLAVNVNKDELIKAINYDRDSYKKGANDGFSYGYKKRDEEIIRCKDCKHREHQDFPSISFCHRTEECLFEVDDEFYCKGGERKETE